MGQPGRLPVTARILRVSCQNAEKRKNSRLLRRSSGESRFNSLLGGLIQLYILLTIFGDFPITFHVKPRPFIDRLFGLEALPKSIKAACAVYHGG